MKTDKKEEGCGVQKEPREGGQDDALLHFGHVCV